MSPAAKAKVEQMRIQRQEGLSDKVRFNFWITLENYDYLCRRAAEEDRTVASLVNSIIRKARQGQPAQ